MFILPSTGVINILSDISYFFTCIATLFAIIDPIGNIPFFIALTEDLSEELRERVSKRATVIAAGLLIVVVISGGAVLKFFGVSVDSLRIAGGILLFMVAIDMLKGTPSSEKYFKKGMQHKDVDSLAVFPIALPIYSGPGAITAAIVLASEAKDFIKMGFLILSIILIYILVRLTHIFSEEITKILGRSGADIFARVMAIFLAGIAAEYISQGIFGEITKFMKNIKMIR